MDRNADRSGNFSMEKAKKLAQSDAGQKLLSALQQSHGQQLQQAMDQANAGDLAAVKKAMADMMNTPEVKAFLRQMGGSNDG